MGRNLPVFSRAGFAPKGMNYAQDALASRNFGRVVMQKFVARFVNDESGATAIEYGLIAALIVIAIIGVLGDVRDALVGLPLSTLINALAAAVS